MTSTNRTFLRSHFTARTPRGGIDTIRTTGTTRSTRAPDRPSLA